jgi:hypothetical protein
MKISAIFPTFSSIKPAAAIAASLPILWSPRRSPTTWRSAPNAVPLQPSLKSTEQSTELCRLLSQVAPRQYSKCLRCQERRGTSPRRKKYQLHNQVQLIPCPCHPCINGRCCRCPPYLRHFPYRLHPCTTCQIRHPICRACRYKPQLVMSYLARSVNLERCSAVSALSISSGHQSAIVPVIFPI